ncbi:MAG TPA: NAD-dependent epimerase/dehydratase family protein, partial [Gemmatimonadaceae bacterium]|nr:NAD-dependent epimerase/dehydratase family protein [Gemmatimonadaceae bacterium]
MSAIAVVTGSSGFIGTRLVRQLVTSGYRVRCLVRPASRAVPRSTRSFHGDVERHTIDYEDAELLQRSAALDGAELVFHLAGVTRARTPREFARGNVMPTVNLLRALEGRSSLRRFVLVSSQAAAGPARALDAPVTEEDPPRPIEAYGASKLQAEDEARACMSRLPVTIARPCSVYGPGDVDFLALFRMARHGLLLYPGTATQYLSLLHVDDLVDGLVAAAEAEAMQGQIVFLCGTTPVRWCDLGTAIAAAVGRRALAVNLPGALVRAAVPLGEAWARVTGRETLLNRHKVALAGPPFWVCSGERASRLL